MLSSLPRKFLRSFIRAGLWLTGMNRGGRLAAIFAEQFDPKVAVLFPDGIRISMACPNTMALWRAQSFLEKEPETIRWINSFQKNDTLLDIGANVGVFTLYAASRGHRVCAVEPESANYFLLNKNLFLNGFDRSVLAYNIAIADECDASQLFLSEFGAARALHTVGKEENYRHEKMVSAFQQGIWQLTLDKLLQGMPNFFPVHIKIDVDGAEARIISGAGSTLRDERLKSVLIEINEELACDMALDDVFRSCGFIRTIREHAVIFNQGDFSRTFNYVYVRKGM